jgi:hypothetical protein
VVVVVVVVVVVGSSSSREHLLVIVSCCVFESKMRLALGWFSSSWFGRLFVGSVVKKSLIVVVVTSFMNIVIVVAVSGGCAEMVATSPNLAPHKARPSPPPAPSYGGRGYDTATVSAMAP